MAKKVKDTEINTPVVLSELNESSEFTIEIVKEYKQLLIGAEYVVSGSVANALINKGIAKVK